ncbi:MAG: GNAT family N-acetyltransferase, partial [Acidobacteriota bacterium]
MHLTTTISGVSLVSWAPEHRKELVLQANDRAVWRNLLPHFPHPYTLDDADRWIDFTSHCAPDVHLCILVEGQVAGSIGVSLGSGTAAQTGEFGYWLGQSFWGRGIATAAASAMVEHIRSTMPVVRLEAAVFAWNPASMRVLEKVGFQRVAVLRQSVFKDGELIDAVLYT